MRITIRPRFNSEPDRRVLVLYPRPSSAYDVAITKILQVFAEKEIAAEFTVINFNNDDARGKAALAMAETSGYGLVFSMGSESTAWMYANYLGGKLPVVSVCSKDPVELGQVKDYEGGSGTNFAYTSLNMPIEVQMAYIRELRPNLRNFAILVDGKNVSAMQTQAQPMAKLARQLGIQALEVVVNDPDNARGELQNLVPAAVRTMKKNDPGLTDSVFWVTGSTAVFKEIAAINAHADRVPVISAVPEIVKPGDDSAAISIGISFESNAHLAAVYGVDVLLGRVQAGELKVGIVSPPDIAISFRKTREIGMAVPFRFFESASYIYDYEGRAVRTAGGTAPGG
jgi:putative ABC transport system substrate-binding protein